MTERQRFQSNPTLFEADYSPFPHSQAKKESRLQIIQGDAGKCELVQAGATELVWREGPFKVVVGAEIGTPKAIGKAMTVKGVHMATEIPMEALERILRAANQDREAETRVAS